MLNFPKVLVYLNVFSTFTPHGKRIDMTRQEQMAKADRAKKILARIEDRIIDLQVLKGGLIMTNNAFRIVLKEHPSILKEFEILRDRKHKIRRFIFKNA